MASAHSGSQARQYEIWVRGHLGETMRPHSPPCGLSSAEVTRC